uniref:Uncharacterized protein n=1 Tax=Panagrolaimus superbus TaxID=310955 RepID=A0A914YW76_9BILA
MINPHPPQMMTLLLLEDAGNDFGDDIDAEPWNDNEDEEDDVTPKASMTADRIRELVEQSRTIVNSEKSAKLESSSSAFPFSSDRLKASTSSLSQQFNLTDKTAVVGKALAKANDDNRGEIFDPIFGIRVKNPKITCATLSTYCTGF